jgi:hypothetical protein
MFPGLSPIMIDRPMGLLPAGAAVVERLPVVSSRRRAAWKPLHCAEGCRRRIAGRSVRVSRTLGRVTGGSTTVWAYTWTTWLERRMVNRGAAVGMAV